MPSPEYYKDLALKMAKRITTHDELVQHLNRMLNITYDHGPVTDGKLLQKVIPKLQHWAKTKSYDEMVDICEAPSNREIPFFFALPTAIHQIRTRDSLHMEAE
jgi:hypothetical protein